MRDYFANEHIDAEQRLLARVRTLEAEMRAREKAWKHMQNTLFELSYAKSLDEMREGFKALWAEIAGES